MAKRKTRKQEEVAVNDGEWSEGKGRKAKGETVGKIEEQISDKVATASDFQVDQLLAKTKEMLTSETLVGNIEAAEKEKQRMHELAIIIAELRALPERYQEVPQVAVPLKSLEQAFERSAEKVMAYFPGEREMALHEAEFRLRIKEIKAIERIGQLVYHTERALENKEIREVEEKIGRAIMQTNKGLEIKSRLPIARVRMSQDGDRYFVPSQVREVEEGADLFVVSVDGEERRFSKGDPSRPDKEKKNWRLTIELANASHRVFYAQQQFRSQIEALREIHGATKSLKALVIDGEDGKTLFFVSWKDRNREDDKPLTGYLLFGANGKMGQVLEVISDEHKKELEELLWECRGQCDLTRKFLGAVPQPLKAILAGQLRREGVDVYAGLAERISQQKAEFEKGKEIVTLDDGLKLARWQVEKLEKAGIPPSVLGVLSRGVKGLMRECGFNSRTAQYVWRAAYKVSRWKK